MRFGYRICRFLSQILFIAFCRGRVFGLENVPLNGGVLLACNHQSFFDPVLATLAIPRDCHYFARDSLFHNRILAPVMAYFNTIPVKRGEADMRAIKEVLRRLKAGNLVLAFPEATRTHDGSIGEMRAGMVLIARKTRVPIVPTLVLGAFEAWPRHRKWPAPHQVIVAYDKPIDPSAHPEWDDDTCVSTVRERLLALQKRYAPHALLRH
jgi:1-acyl-sn-glycerol-3-phosphate acyltransferase